MLMSSLMKGIASASIFSLAGFALGFFDHIWLSALMILVTMLISFWLRLKILRNEMHSHIVLGGVSSERYFGVIFVAYIFRRSGRLSFWSGGNYSAVGRCLSFVAACRCPAWC